MQFPWLDKRIQVPRVAVPRFAESMGFVETNGFTFSPDRLNIAVEFHIMTLLPVNHSTFRHDLSGDGSYLHSQWGG